MLFNCLKGRPHSRPNFQNHHKPVLPFHGTLQHSHINPLDVSIGRVKNHYSLLKYMGPKQTANEKKWSTSPQRVRPASGHCILCHLHASGWVGVSGYVWVWVCTCVCNPWNRKPGETRSLISASILKCFALTIIPIILTIPNHEQESSLITVD